MVNEDVRQRASDRAELVAAAREHTAAVELHLERVAKRLREHAGAAGPAGMRQAGSGPGAPRWAPPPASALRDLSRLLLADASLDALLGTVLGLARSGVHGCDGASVTLVRDGHVETPAATDEDVAAADRAQYSGRQGPCYEAATTGATRLSPVLPDPRWPMFGARAAQLGWAGVLSVPLRTRAGLLGALNLYSRVAGAFGVAQVSVSEALAEHVAVALTNARDFREQQATAASLQRSLLPPRLPRLPGVAFAARYRPASSGINVGGDWYDVLPLHGGELALVIGDVAGHGLAAATTMAQLRTAVRAYALEGHDPAAVLTLVGRFLRQVEPEGYATCCYVMLDPVNRAVHWCNAGHLDPLLVTPDGRACTLGGPGRLPALGVPGPEGDVKPGRAVLPPGSRLLLFTDGLVERRRESLDVGLERLARSAAALVDGEAPLQTWCDDVVAAQLADREVGDDVAVLAVELSGPPSRLAQEHEVSKVAG